jgi:hypothetical protein
MDKIKDVYGVSAGIRDEDMMVRIRRNSERGLQHIDRRDKFFVSCDEL